MRARSAARYTPQEAAALAGVRLQRIQNAITDRQLGRAFRPGPDGRRRIDLPALLTFAVIDRLEEVRIEPSALCRKLREVGGVPRAPLASTEAVTIDAPKLLAPVAHNLKLYERARERIVSDAGILAGLPVVRDTRVPARTPHARITGGDGIESVPEDDPCLDRETVEAAVLHVEANPRPRPGELCAERRRAAPGQPRPATAQRVWWSSPPETTSPRRRPRSGACAPHRIGPSSTTDTPHLGNVG